MAQPGFEKIEQTDKTLYGPRKILLCGFAAKVQSKFHTLLGMIGITGIPLVWVTEAQIDETLDNLLELPDGSGTGQSSSLARAIIVSGVTQNELHNLMTACRKAGMKQALWAALTPTSSQWRLGRLLVKLSAERKALANKADAGDR